MATVGPEPVARWAREHEVVDAPVSGGVARAGDGDLLIMVSGAAEAIERVQPLLDALARTRRVVGEAPGDGQKVKLVNQLLCGVHIAAAAEALAFAEALGLDARGCWEVCATARQPRSCSTTAASACSTRPSRTPKSALDIFVKDMGLVWRPPATAASRHRWPPPPSSSTCAGSRAGPRPARRLLADHAAASAGRRRRARPVRTAAMAPETGPSSEPTSRS